MRRKEDARKILEKLDPVDLTIAIWIIHAYRLRNYIVCRLRWLTEYPAPISFMFGVVTYEYMIAMRISRSGSLLAAMLIACGIAAIIYSASSISNEPPPPPRTVNHSVNKSADE